MVAISPAFATERIDHSHKYFLGANALANIYTIYVAPGATIYGGYRWHNLGLELGYSQLWDDNWGEDVTFNSRNLYLVGNGFLPISNRFELKGSVGAGLFFSTVRNNDWLVFWYPQGKSHYQAVGFRAGFGPVFKFNQHLSTELMVNFQTNCSVLIGFMTIISFGLTYHI